MFCRAFLTALCLLAVSCSRSTTAAPPRRLAILRFENLSADPSLDWMGRAFSEIVSRDLAGAPNMYAIPPSRLHALDGAFGRRAAALPGVSSERSEALAAGADQLGYGEYWIGRGAVHARLTLDDVPDGNRQVISVSAAGLTAAAGALARQISSQASISGTLNAVAVQAYILGLEAWDPQEAARRFQESIAADPDFGLPYTVLAQLRLQQRDREGASALLEQALAHRDRMPEIDRAQLMLDAASVRGDQATERRAVADLARLTPNDPAVWRSMAETAMAHRQYGQADEACQKALLLQPDDPVVLNLLGYASAYTGSLEASMRALRQYQSLRPSDANPLDSMGDVNLLLGRLPEAESFYLQEAAKDETPRAGAGLRKAAVARLMNGDITGAATLTEQYLERRAKLRDPLVDYYRAEWLWLSGNRKEAYQRLQEFARREEGGPLKDAAAQAYAELAVWSVALGNRAGAALAAEKAGQLAGPASGAAVAVARFLVQSSASPAEWTARADRAFPQPAAKPLRDRALAYALLAERQFAAASTLLKSLYDEGAPAGGNDEIPLLLAWCYLETGRPKEATALLRFNPLPSGAGLQPFQVFSFPRFFYLRGRLAALSGQAGPAREQYRIFLKLSGDTPLSWGEEAQAR